MKEQKRTVQGRGPSRSPGRPSRKPGRPRQFRTNWSCEIPGRRQCRHVGRVLGRGAGRRGDAGGVCARSRAVPWCAVPCASRPSHGTLARARPCECVRSMWPALGEGEPSRGVTLGWEPVAHARSAVRPIGARVCDPESRTVGERPTVGTDRTVEYCNRNSNELKTRPTQTN